MARSRIDAAGLRFVGGFFLLTAVLSFVVQVSWVTERIILPYTRFITGVSAGILNSTGYAVQVQDTSLMRNGIAVEIRRGCDGIEAAILLLAACLAYPARWKSRLTGALTGFALIFVLNLVRIVVLSYVGFTGSQKSFDFAHVYVAQFAVIACTMVFWIFWAGRQRTIRP